MSNQPRGSRDSSGSGGQGGAGGAANVPGFQHPHCDRQAMYDQPVRKQRTKGGKFGAHYSAVWVVCLSITMLLLHPHHQLGWQRDRSSVYGFWFQVLFCYCFFFFVGFLSLPLCNKL